MRLQSKITTYFIFIEAICFAQPSERKLTAEQYIENFKEEAIKEMLIYNIPASITLAQGMLESGNGNSDLAVYANNHFGIKCHNEWNGLTFTKDDDAKDECFRKYETVLDSYTDHSEFLKSRPRYSKLFELKISDYKSWAKGLKETGYATDPRYTERLLELIENYKLYKYDVVDELPSIKTAAPKLVVEKMQAHEIYSFHITKYIIIKPNDNIESIANETNKTVKELCKYNDLKSTNNLIAGQKLYIQPKRNKAKEPFHYVNKNETMYFISQLHGIKLKSLYKKNRMKIGDEPKIGQKIYLRKTKPEDISNI